MSVNTDQNCVYDSNSTSVNNSLTVEGNGRLRSNRTDTYQNTVTLRQAVKCRRLEIIQYTGGQQEKYVLPLVSPVWSFWDHVRYFSSTVCSFPFVVVEISLL